MKRLSILLFLLGACLHLIIAQTGPLPIAQLIEVYNNPSKYPNSLVSTKD